jgi:hypothetical protein
LTKFLAESVAFHVFVKPPFETAVVGAGPPVHMYNVSKKLMNVELKAVPFEGPRRKSRDERGSVGGQS